MSSPQDYETPLGFEHQSEYVNFQPANYEQFTLQQRASEPHLYQVLEPSTDPDLYASVHVDPTMNIESENNPTVEINTNKTENPAKTKSVTPPVDYHNQREYETPVIVSKILMAAIYSIGVLVLMAIASIAIIALVQVQELRREIEAQRAVTADIQAITAGIPTTITDISQLNSTLFSQYYALKDSISNATQSLLDKYTENYEMRTQNLEEIIKSVPQCEVIERTGCTDQDCLISTENAVVLQSSCSNGGELTVAPTRISCVCSNVTECNLRVVRCRFV